MTNTKIAQIVREDFGDEDRRVWFYNVYLNGESVCLFESLAEAQLFCGKNNYTFSK